MEFFDVIHNRRSVRRFLSYPVDKNDVYKLIDAANQAPSSGNIDNWQFVIVEDEHTRIELASAAHAQFWISEAPLVIVVLSETERVRRVYGDKGNFYAIQNVASAIENMLLAAEDMDIGACWVGSFDEKWVKRVLLIPDAIDVHALIVLGPKGEKPPKPKRTLVDVKVFFERYGKRSKW